MEAREFIRKYRITNEGTKKKLKDKKFLKAAEAIISSYPERGDIDYFTRNALPVMLEKALQCSVSLPNKTLPSVSLSA